MTTAQSGIPGSVNTSRIIVSEITTAGYTVLDADLSGQKLFKLNTAAANTIIVFFIFFCFC